MALRQCCSALRVESRAVWSPVRCMSGGEPGSGAGHGGGGGGAIRDAGGSFGKMEHAHEEQYFRQKEREKLEELKQHLDDEVAHHQNEINRHEENIARHKKRIADLESKHE